MREDLMDMNNLAVKFAKQNRGKGKVVKVTSYSFWWETLPDKNGNTNIAGVPFI